MIKNRRVSKAEFHADSCSAFCLQEPSPVRNGRELRRPSGEDLPKKISNDDLVIPPPGPFFDCAPVGCVILDEKACLRQVNPAALSLLDSGDQDRLQGKSFLPFIARDFQPTFLAHLKTCSTGTAKQTIEVELRIPDSLSYLPARLDTVFYGNDDGNGPLFISILTDMTEKKEMEEVWRKSEALYQRIVEEHTEMICRFSREGEITFANDAMCHAFNLSRKELIGTSILKLFHTRDRKRVKEHLALMNPSEPVQPIEHRVVMADGQIRWHRWIHRKITDGKGMLVEYQSAGRDITREKETQEALLKAREKLEKNVAERTAELTTLNKALRKKLAEHKETQKNIFSDHEQLRALTSALITTEERERRRIATELHDHIGQTLAITRIKLEMLHALASYSGFAEALEEIQGFVKQAIRETRSLMTKLSPPVFYELGLNAALEWLMQYFGEQHNLRIIYKGRYQSVSVDEDLQILLLQATRELLMNVVKHAGVEEAEVNLKKNRKQIKIEVIDHGAGFEVSKIGTPLDWRGGFGIFSIHERLKNLGGQLQIRSKPGEGTHFTLIAPHGTKEGHKKGE